VFDQAKGNSSDGNDGECNDQEDPFHCAHGADGSLTR
jgi:hypothetical protein